MHWQIGQQTLDLTRRGVVMGILNVTPDSFSDGGRHHALEGALAHARRMITEGAGIIDVGGESTRPGAKAVGADEEIGRTLPLIRALRQEWQGLISIDTWKAQVAREALLAGADIVNDVSGLLGDPEMTGVCRDSGCGVVVMHRQGTPDVMQLAPVYEDVVREVGAFFQERLRSLTAAGLRESALCFDPGIGFGKTVAHNLELLRALDRLAPAGRPLLLGVSRKSFIGRVLESEVLEDRDWPTVAMTARARELGVRLHRVHEVRPNLEAIRMIEAIRNGV